MSARNHGTAPRLTMALDMIRRSNEILNRLENPGSNRTTAQSSTANAEQFPEGPQQTEDVAGNVPADTSAPPLPSDPDSLNVYVSNLFLRILVTLVFQIYNSTKKVICI